MSKEMYESIIVTVGVSATLAVFSYVMKRMFNSIFDRLDALEVKSEQAVTKATEIERNYIDRFNETNMNISNTRHSLKNDIQRFATNVEYVGDNLEELKQTVNVKIEQIEKRIDTITQNCFNFHTKGGE